MYAIPPPADNLLRPEIEHRLTRQVGRPPSEPIISYESLSYQAGSRGRPRRVVVKLKWHSGGLFTRVGFMVTNLRRATE